MTWRPTGREARERRAAAEQMPGQMAIDMPPPVYVGDGEALDDDDPADESVLVHTSETPPAGQTKRPRKGTGRGKRNA